LVSPLSLLVQSREQRVRGMSRRRRAKGERWSRSRSRTRTRTRTPAAARVPVSLSDSPRRSTAAAAPQPIAPSRLSRRRPRYLYTPSRALLACHTSRHHLLLVRPRPLARPSDPARAAVRLRVALHAFPVSLSPLDVDADGCLRADIYYKICARRGAWTTRVQTHTDTDANATGGVYVASGTSIGLYTGRWGCT